MMDLSYVLKDYRISHTAMIIYGLLESLSNAPISKQKGYVFISRKSIAARVNKCERTARKCVKELESVGLIQIKRMGRGLNDRIWVLPPHCTQEEAKKKISSSNLSIYRSKSVEVAALKVNKEKAMNNTVDKSINPENQALCASANVEDKGLTAKKGRPTNKRPHKDINKQKAARQQYINLLKVKLKYNEYIHDMFVMQEDIDALNRIIQTIANFMAGNTKIMVNGVLMDKKQWWDVVQNISQGEILRLIERIPHFNNVRKPYAYLMACIYNAALHETLTKPWFVPDEARFSMY